MKTAITKEHVRNHRRNRRTKNEKKYRSELKRGALAARIAPKLRGSVNSLKLRNRDEVIRFARKETGHTCDNAARCDCEVSR